MSFASLTFLIFFAIVAAMLSLTNTKRIAGFCNGSILKVRHYMLLIASYIFYGWWDWRFCFLMLFMSAVAYFSAIKILDKKRPEFYRVLGILVPLLVLGIFKYFNFFIDSFTDLFNISKIGTLNIILPVGISFYTFQSLSYTIDVSRGKLPPERDFAKLALYIAFFPQLVAGPIVKAADFLPQLYEDRNVSSKNFSRGIQIFLAGFIKKIIFADYLSVFVDDVFAVPMAYNGLSIVLAIISYSIQIYFDFSGYSDMAIGCAKCMGYDLQINFNLPYISRNISEFWKRWHISLSSWLKEYLYIPLGGNRRGKARTYINLMITMVLGGLWHGARWTFVFWGTLYGVALCVHKFYISKHKRVRDKPALLKFFDICLTYVFVLLCWVFFRAEDFTTALAIFRRMFVWDSGIVQPYIWTFIAVLTLVTASICAFVKHKREGVSDSVDGFYAILNLSKFRNLVLFIFVVGLTIGLAYTGANPFIYFQF